MADTTLALARPGALASPSLDPIQLHAQASNAVSRCSRELRADACDYAAAERHLVEAAQAVRALASLDVHAAR